MVSIDREDHLPEAKRGTNGAVRGQVQRLVAPVLRHLTLLCDFFLQPEVYKRFR
jgi:hypothetical protein